MDRRYEVRTAQVPPDAVADEEGFTVAMVRVSRHGEVSVLWLPEVFGDPLPKAVREAIVERLRLHADKLESGEMEQEMQKFVGVNRPQNRSERKQ